MSMPVFERLTLAASNDTVNGGSATANCYSDSISLGDAESMSMQVTVNSIWGAGTAPPMLDVFVEFSSDGVNFEDGGANMIQPINSTNIGTSLSAGGVCGEYFRLRGTFTLDGAGTTGPGAVTASVWITLGAGDL